LVAVTQRRDVSNRPGLAALRGALGDRRRNVVAVVLVVGPVALALVVGSRVALYGAALTAFVVWMGWFVLTAVDWLERADF
jgi:type III secretory pathway component EscU